MKILLVIVTFVTLLLAANTTQSTKPTANMQMGPVPRPTCPEDSCR